MRHGVWLWSCLCGLCRVGYARFGGKIQLIGSLITPLEDKSFVLGARPISRGELLTFCGVIPNFEEKQVFSTAHHPIYEHSFFGGATGECLEEASTFSSGPSLVLLASAAAVKADPRRLGHEKRPFFLAKQEVKNSCFLFFGKDFCWIFVNLGSFNHWRVLLNPQILFSFCSEHAAS